MKRVHQGGRGLERSLLFSQMFIIQVPGCLESMFIKGQGVERSLIGKRGGRGGPGHKKGEARIDSRYYGILE